MSESEELAKNLALSKMAEADFLEAKQKLDKQNLILAKRIVDAETKLETTEVEVELNEFYAESLKARETLLQNLILNGKLSKIIEANKKRQEKIHEVEKLEGYDLSLSAPGKKELGLVISGEEYEPSLENLGLTNTGIKFLNLNGNLFVIKDGEFDVSSEDNINMLRTLSSDDMEKLLSRYPELAFRLDVDTLLDRDLRVKILKALATFVFNEFGSSDATAINRKLGEPLSLRRKTVNTFEAYLGGLKNMFKVKIRKYLLEKKPDALDEIGKLPCNIHSPLLPDDLYEPETEKSESEKSEKSIEDQIDDFLKSLSDEV